MTLTPTQRKQAQRSRLISGGGRRVEVHLTGDDLTALQGWAKAKGIDRLSDAVKEMIRRMAK